MPWILASVAPTTIVSEHMAAMVICASWYLFRKSLSVLAVARQAVAMPATLAVMERGSITKAHQQTENTGQCRAN